MDAELVRLKKPAALESLQEFRAFAAHAAAQACLDQIEKDQLDLVLEELLVNVARYAYPEDEPGDVELAYRVESPGRVYFEILDAGSEFDPLLSEPPDLTRGLADRPIGGLGVFLVKNIASSLSYERREGLNCLAFRMGKAI